MVRTPILAFRSSASPTCSPSPVRKARPCCRTCLSSIEQHVEWVTDCIDSMRKTGKTVIEAKPEAQDQWVAHVNEVVSATLMTKANSWYMSANIAGKPRAFLPYLGPEGVGGYRRKCDEIAAKGYEGFDSGVASRT